MPRHTKEVKPRNGMHEHSTGCLKVNLMQWDEELTTFGVLSTNLDGTLLRR